MTRTEFSRLLRTKISSIAAIVASALVLLMILAVFFQTILWILPESAASTIKNWIHTVFENPQMIRETLLRSGPMKELIFLGLQCLQVLFAPIPGQLVALAGGYVFGFWKGFWLTILGLGLGSFIAIGLSRILGENWVRKIIPPSIMTQFDRLISNGGYETFFMIYLLPALPDDAICFLAGLTKLKIPLLMVVCLLGRAPGMAVLSLVGSGFTQGDSFFAQALLITLTIASIPLWLFWETITEKLHRRFLHFK